MDELSVLKQTLFWSTLLALTGALATALTLIEPPPHLTTPSKSFIRNPASEADLTTTLTEELDVLCPSNAKSTYSGFAAQIRLHGESCLEGPHVFKTTAIVNKSNAFSATVFAVSDTRFTTDYISLKPGENRIEITQVSTTGGTRVQDIVLSR